MTLISLDQSEYKRLDAKAYDREKRRLRIELLKLQEDVIKNNSDALFKGWMIAHVALSIVVTILMVFHITMVFYYK